MPRTVHRADPPGAGVLHPPPPDPAVLAGITENASQITVAAAAVTTALGDGDPQPKNGLHEAASAG
jgi:hypothetical protein